MTETAFFCPKCRMTTTRQGRQPYCRDCMREANRATRERHRSRTLEQVLADQPPEQRCTDCKTVKPKEMFSIDRSRKAGLQAVCNACRVVYNRLRYNKRGQDAP